MSVSIMAKVFWTDYPDLDYVNKNGKRVSVANTSAKITMLAIADSADDFGENSWNSFDTLKTKTGMKQRRSVMRVVRALIDHGYLSVMGLSNYGTNNFKIALDRMGDLPKKRAVNGRPKIEEIKTGDSGAKTGDSGAKTGDSEIPDSSFIPSESVHIDDFQKIKEAADKTIDGIIMLGNMPGAKAAIRREGLSARIEKTLHGKKPNSAQGVKFVEFVDKKEQSGQKWEVFARWMQSQPGYDPNFWGWARMTDDWGRAFTTSYAQHGERAHAL